MRKNVTGLVSPGGIGKTQLIVNTCLAVTSGLDTLLGMPICQRTKVWYWNQEDDAEELERRIGAARQHFEIAEIDLTIDGAAALFTNSGVSRPLVLVERRSDGAIAETKMVGEIIARIKALGIGVFISTPLSSSTKPMKTTTCRCGP